ncbi:MAG TPA: TonB-dependent receptor, partial [Saprospiraceae bacterium]|nr:TonB-dependent receptor [Saprospiraceae bacterium]
MSMTAQFALRAFSLELVLIFLWTTGSNAQIDSINQLQQVEVTAQRINLTDIGKHTETIDSNTLSIKHHESLAGLLRIYTPLYVRSYGAGTLATLGIRGGGAAHTQILWNGIPLRNPMLGLVDLALIPSVFVDETSIHYGGHGAAFGSGAVGGLISVSNQQLNQQETFQLGMTAGSWGNRSGHIRINYGSGIVKFSSRIFMQDADNNYRYRISKESPEKNQVHNHIIDYGVLQEAYVPFASHHSVTARLWYQEAKRQLPPLTTQSTSKAAQQDKNLRTSLQWNYQGDKLQWQIKSAWLDETIDYQDTLILLFTHNRFTTWLGEASASFKLGEGIHFTGGLYTEISKGESANYLEGLSRTQSAVFSSVSFHTGDLIWRLQGREEVTEKKLSPLLFDIAAELPLPENVTFKTSFSRNYRMPTLNDLNWRPGGNPNLKPEEGFTFEAGLDHQVKTTNVTIQSSFNGYTRLMNEWIMWMPPVKDVSLFWSPINVAKVKSTGFEMRNDFTLTQKDWVINLRLGLDLTWSVFSTDIPEFRIEAGDRLFYVPVENVLTSLRFELHRWTLHYDHHWFGDATGINDAIDPFNLGNGGISYRFGKRKVTGSVFLQAENVWNVPYRIIERRP